MRKRSTFGWLELILGILFIILGIYTFINPSAAIGTVVVIYGIAAVISGIVDIVLYNKLEKRIGLGPATLMVSAIINIIVGILLLFNVGAGKIALSILFPLWFMIRCVGRLANLSFVRMFGTAGDYWLSLILNTVGIILAIILLFNPFASAVSFAYIIGLYLVILGIGSIALAFSKVGEE